MCGYRRAVAAQSIERQGGVNVSTVNDDGPSALGRPQLLTASAASNRGERKEWQPRCRSPSGTERRTSGLVVLNGSPVFLLRIKGVALCSRR